MKLRSAKDFWSGLVFMAVGAGFAVGALNHGFGTATAPGPGAFPFAAGVLAALGGAALLFKSLTLETEGGDRLGAWALRPLLLITVAVAGFSWSLPHLGLCFAVPGLVLLSALATGGVRIQTLGLQLIVLTAAAWGLYVGWVHAVVPLWT